VSRGAAGRESSVQGVQRGQSKEGCMAGKKGGKKAAYAGYAAHAGYALAPQQKMHLRVQQNACLPIPASRCMPSRTRGECKAGETLFAHATVCVSTHLAVGGQADADDGPTGCKGLLQRGTHVLLALVGVKAADEDGGALSVALCTHNRQDGRHSMNVEAHACGCTDMGPAGPVCLLGAGCGYKARVHEVDAECRSMLLHVLGDTYEHKKGWGDEMAAAQPLGLAGAHD